MRVQNPKILLARHRLLAKKSWGQNFLVDPSYPERIAQACAIDREDVVVEIGAGLGHLTMALASRAGRVVAVERDRDLARVLRLELPVDAPIEVVEANAVTFDFGEVYSQAGRKLIVAGNLPYHLSSQILFRLIEQHAFLRRFVLMLQKEVADRLVASPGTKSYGALTVLAGMHVEVKRAFDVPPQAFHPRPAVTSTVARFEVLAQPRAEVGDYALFRQVVHAAFAHRRKMLRNTLQGARSRSGRPALHPDQIEQALAVSGIDPKVRAESLSVEDFATLCRALESPSIAETSRDG